MYRAGLDAQVICQTQGKGLGSELSEPLPGFSLLLCSAQFRHWQSMTPGGGQGSKGIPAWAAEAEGLPRATVPAQWEDTVAVPSRGVNRER